MTKGMTLESAASNLNRLYGDSADDFISIEEMLMNVKRPGGDTPKNRDWIYSKLSAIRHHDLFVKEYTTRNHVRWLKGIRLTTTGRLARAAASISTDVAKLDASDSSSEEPRNRELSFVSVRAEIKKLRAMYPEFDITFQVQLKEEDD